MDKYRLVGLLEEFKDRLYGRIYFSEFKFDTWDADDSYQDLCLGLLEANERGVIDEKKINKSFFFVVGRNKVRNKFRSKKSRIKDVPFYERYSPVDLDIEAIIMNLNLLEEVEKVLSTMGGKQVEAFRRRIYYEETCLAIAESTGIPSTNAVTSHISNVRRHLKEVLDIN